MSGKANSFGANESSHSLFVSAVADPLALAHNDNMDISIHLSIDKRNIVNQINAPVLDGFDRGWAAAVYSYHKYSWRLESCSARTIGSEMTVKPKMFPTHLHSSLEGSGPELASHPCQFPDPDESSSTLPRYGNSCKEWRKGTSQGMKGTQK